ncbi:MAG: chemotaxis protein CheR [Desulfobacterium sp.]|nr:chemotaxis protein CheR [Desulfobacterium sp.]
MVDPWCSPSPHPHLSPGDFNKLSRFIQERLGIKMPMVKKGMIESRLRKRLNHLNIKLYSHYCDYLFSPEGAEKELPYFIDEVTTNKTDFFREPKHFTCLVEMILPRLLAAQGPGKKKKLMAWSCACSQGDEPYTLAMVLSEFARRSPGFDFSILATDISNRVLETAKKGVYDTTEIEPVPMALRKKYLLKSRDRTRGLVRIVPELRRKVDFRRLNLMDKRFAIGQKLDIIFCRNVTIYFDNETTEQLLIKLCDQLVTGGFIFMGHSEFLDCKRLPLVAVAPTVYRKVK